MSLKSEVKSDKPKAKLNDSDESEEEEPPLPLFNIMFVFSKLIMFMGASVVSMLLFVCTNMSSL